jgi:hypothetical protein
LVNSKQELQPIEKVGNIVYLRKNIQQVDLNIPEGTEKIFQADEVWFEKENIDLQHIHDNFELYWDWAKAKRENEALELERRANVYDLTKKDYGLADLKEMVDQLIIDSLN